MSTLVDTPPSPPATGVTLLPTPIAGLAPRGVAAVALAALAVALLAPGQRHGLGLALALGALVVAGAVAVHAEQRLDAHGWTCVALAVATVAQWARSDAVEVLAPATVAALLVAGLGVAGPRSGLAHLRALVVTPLLAPAAPLPVARGLRRVRAGRRVPVVPVVATLVVLVVFGALLASADAAFEALLDGLVPALDDTTVARIVLGLLAAAAVATVVLAARAVAAAPEPEVPVRARQDWLAPVVALDLLFAVFLVVQAGALFGGAERVGSVDGLTFADQARGGFFQLVVVAALVLLVVGVVVRVADPAERRSRDVGLGLLLAQTVVLLVSAGHRLAVYEAAYGSTRLRLAAWAALVWVALVLALVVVARLRAGLGAHVVRSAVVLVGVVAFAFVAVRPDVVVAERNLARASAGAELDTALLLELSADARPVVRDGFARLGLPDPGPLDGPTDGLAWNLARVRAAG